MTDPGGWALLAAFLLASLRCAQLWRTASRVDVINSVVLSTLAQGRGEELSQVLGRAGSGVYLAVAQAICEPVRKLREGTDREVRARLDRDARAALLRAVRRVQRLAWLDHLALLGILFAGLGALTGAATPVRALELLAATLLWLSNLLGARSQVTRCVAGATALVDSLVEARPHLPRTSVAPAPVATP